MTTVSGLYTGRNALDARCRSILRLDVDGDYCQMMASGTISRRGRLAVDWKAGLKLGPSRVWTGKIEPKEVVPPDSSFPHTVTIRVTGTTPESLMARVVFSAPGCSNVVAIHRLRSKHFRQVRIELDTVSDAKAVLEIDPTSAQPHPSTLPHHLSIDQVYSRAGIKVWTAQGAEPIPTGCAGSNERWSDQELHDAMQTKWNHGADLPQGSVWVLFAGAHELDGRLGVMFDYFGARHRQGVAVFNHTLSGEYPGSSPGFRRMLFYTVAHEIGHALNLPHPSDPKILTFMNRPRASMSMGGLGEENFFREFQYRFSDEELQHLRHAPDHLVQPGHAPWLHHDEKHRSRDFELILRANRPDPVFEFMEPVVLELKLRNISARTQRVLADLLAHQDEMTVVVRREGGRGKRLASFMRHCCAREEEPLGPGESLYESLFISAGPQGWLVDRPGHYTVQVSVEIDGATVISNCYGLTIRSPADPVQERLAQDYFKADTARVIAFDGSRAEALRPAINALHSVTQQVPGTSVAIHAQVALALPGTRRYRTLDPSTAGAGRRFRHAEVMREEVHALERALTASSAEQLLGHIDYRFYVDRLTDAFAQLDDLDAAAAAQQALKKRFIRRGVLKRVVGEVAQREAALRRGRQATQPRGR
jgi:hypothetical protein